MEEKNAREALAQRVARLKEKREELEIRTARLELYNKGKSAALRATSTSLKREIEQAEEELKEIDRTYEEKPSHSTVPPDRFMECVRPLDRELRRGARALRRNKKLFFPFFSRHPAVELAQALHSASKEAHALLKELPSLEIPSSLAEMYTLFCRNLIAEIEKRWNPLLYRTGFEQLYADWENLRHASQSRELEAADSP